MSTTPKWAEPDIVSWSRLLLRTFRQKVGRDLIPRNGSPEDQARALFLAPFVVASHGTEADPVLNYGNRTAQDLWEMSWEQFVRTPSRMTAEPENREERARLLEQAAIRGYIDHYQGIRISRTGRRFRVKNAVVWTLVDDTNRPCGQAATFSEWEFL